MKQLKLFLLVALLIIGGQLTYSQNEKKESYPIMTFEQTSFDLGTLHEGDSVDLVYKFTNTGTAPLSIKKIKASCGCTVPSGWKKDLIMPGEKSQFKVKFNSKNKIHKQHKTIKITCNTKKGIEIVRFTANVIPDPKMEKQREERRKKWAERRKKQQQKNKALRAKKQVKLTPEEKKIIKEKVYKKQIKSKKLEIKILKQELKLEKKIYKNKLTQKEIKAERQRISKLKLKVSDLKSKIYKLNRKLK